MITQSMSVAGHHVLEFMSIQMDTIAEERFALLPSPKYAHFFGLQSLDDHRDMQSKQMIGGPRLSCMWKDVYNIYLNIIS